MSGFQASVIGTVQSFANAVAVDVSTRHPSATPPPEARNVAVQRDEIDPALRAWGDIEERGSGDVHTPHAEVNLKQKAVNSSDSDTRCDEPCGAEPEPESQDHEEEDTAAHHKEAEHQSSGGGALIDVTLIDADVLESGEQKDKGGDGDVVDVTLLDVGVG
jgi:hypothetical protein